MKLCHTLTLLFLIPIPALAIDAALQSSYDTNIVNSPEGNELLSAWVVEAQVSNNFALVEKASYIVEVFASVNLNVPYDYDALSTVRSELGAGYQWQSKTGFRAPWYSAKTSVGITLGQYDHQRTVDVTAVLFRNQRLTDKLFISQGIQYRQSWGKESALNGGLASGTINVDWAVTPSIALYAQPSVGYGRFQSSYHGMLAKTAVKVTAKTDPEIRTKIEPEIKNLAATNVRSSHIISDDYFLNEALTETMNENWYSYGVDAAFATAILGLNKRLSQNTSLDIAYQYALVNSDVLSYIRHQAFLSVYMHW